VQQKSPRSWHIVLSRARTRRAGAALIALLFFLRGPIVFGQQDDPSEIFLKAYLSAQLGEKLERESRFKTALAKYRFAGSLIESLRKSHADWQPAIVEYRGRRVSEGILRIQERVNRQRALSASASNLPEVAPALPESDAWSEPGPELVAAGSDENDAQTTSDGAIKKATKKLRDKVDQLQAALDKARSDLQTARKEKENLNSRVNDNATKLEKAQDQLDKASKSEQQAREQLAHAQESLKATQASQESGGREQEQLRAQIAQLKETGAAADHARATAEKQRDEAQTKFAEASMQITALEQQRDEALAQLTVARQTEQELRALVADKDELQQLLASAEKNVQTLDKSDPGDAQKFVEIKEQVAKLQGHLSETEKRNDYLQARAAELHVQLDDATTELQAAKLAGANSQESAQLAKENEILRNIVVRERGEEARRDDARKLVLAELGRLKIRSEKLNQQIEFLAQPVTKLTSEELNLLRQPVLAVSDQRRGMFKASFVFEKKSEEPVASDGIQKSGRETAATLNSPGRLEPELPRKFQDVARAAKSNLDHGKYRAAEKQYQDILAKYPNNFEALSNVAVVYVRSGKLPLAESALEKAVVIEPNNDFLLTTLGIVHYRQSKFDDAIVELKRAISINPKSATAHNYLGIAASQKGRQQEAEKEILQALANNPDDADAHFNLAVILVTTQPGSKELARRHYARATALGTQRSVSLEKLLQ
jgi:Flp pilus assembly protein TadD/predicted  nucleic acid-binding Zn-ribbon protein